MTESEEKSETPRDPLGKFTILKCGRSAKKTSSWLFSQPSPNTLSLSPPSLSLSLSRSSTADSCTVRETDCCHGNYICTQLGMCLCVSASVSPWPSTDQNPALREGSGEARARQAGRQAGDWMDQWTVSKTSRRDNTSHVL